MTELSDDLLVAYVDGQLARKQVRAVDKVLDQDDILAARVDALKHAHARLEAAFEAILAGEEMDVSATSIPQDKGLLISWRAVNFTFAGLSLAGALALAGIGFGWPLSIPGVGSLPQFDWSSSQTVTIPVTPVNWQEEAARAHALLSRQTLEVGLESQANYSFVALQLAKILGTDAKLPNLEPQGFRFIRAQALRFGNEPLTQILYLGAEGGPLALYAKKGEGDGSATLKEGKLGDIRTVSWSEDGISYLLAGDVDASALTRMATRIKLEPVPPLRIAPKSQSPVNSALDKQD
jgi:anti-sigma factor RsiW